jgi:hypothetical protein
MCCQSLRIGDLSRWWGQIHSMEDNVSFDFLCEVPPEAMGGSPWRHDASPWGPWRSTLKTWNLHLKPTKLTLETWRLTPGALRLTCTVGKETDTGAMDAHPVDKDVLLGAMVATGWRCRGLPWRDRGLQWSVKLLPGPWEAHTRDLDTQPRAITMFCSLSGEQWIRCTQRLFLLKWFIHSEKNNSPHLRVLKIWLSSSLFAEIAWCWNGLEKSKNILTLFHTRPEL